MPVASDQIKILVSRVSGNGDILKCKHLHTKLTCLPWNKFGAVNATTAYIARYILEGLLMFITTGDAGLFTADMRLVEWSLTVQTMRKLFRYLDTKGILLKLRTISRPTALVHEFMRLTVDYRTTVLNIDTSNFENNNRIAIGDLMLWQAADDVYMFARHIPLFTFGGWAAQDTLSMVGEMILAFGSRYDLDARLPGAGTFYLVANGLYNMIYTWNPMLSTALMCAQNVGSFMTHFGLPANLLIYPLESMEWMHEIARRLRYAQGDVGVRRDVWRVSISDVLFHFPNLQKVASVLIGEIFTQLHNLACELFPEIDSGAPPDLWLARMETLYSKRKQLVRQSVYRRALRSPPV